jgi:hypothetical protein
MTLIAIVWIETVTLDNYKRFECEAARGIIAEILIVTFGDDNCMIVECKAPDSIIARRVSVGNRRDNNSGLDRNQ